MAPFSDSAGKKMRDCLKSKAFELKLTFEGVRLGAIDVTALVFLKCLLAAMYCVSRLFDSDSEEES